MKKLLAVRIKHLILVCFLIIGEHFTVIAQPAAIADLIGKEKEALIQTISSLQADHAVSSPVIDNLQLQVDHANRQIAEYKKLNTLEKEKARRSIGYFLSEANKFIKRKKLHLYQLADAFNAYQDVLDVMLRRQPLLPVLRHVSAENAALIAAAFTQYKEFSLLEDIATFKRVSASPEYILYFIESKPSFRFSDSLLLEAVRYDPVNVMYFLQKNNSVLKQKLQDAPDSYIRQVVSLAKNKNAGELALFAPQLDKGSISAEAVLEARSQPVKYFQLLVNTLLESRNNLTANLMRNGIREKALSFFVNQINELHNAADAVRFASVNNLRPEDLYFIITTCGDELYTSSYLGLYKRITAALPSTSIDSLFEKVQWENFDVFIRMAANYNVLDDFLKRLSPDKLNEVLQLFIGYLDSDPKTAVEKAMDIADSFGNMVSSPATMDLFQAEIQANLDRCRKKQKLLGTRLYTILNNLLTLTRQEGGVEKIWRTLGDYESLKFSSLADNNQNIAEVVLFYGDEDGVASFTNFLKNYKKENWKLVRNDYWVSIESLKQPAVKIFANLPLEMSSKADVAAQDKLFDYLSSNSIQPAIIVHRGHSYHLDKTLKRLSPSVRLAILGSCGGYNKSISIATVNPDVQVIGSKKTGSKAINDPMLDMINETISNGKDLYWPAIWSRLEARFKKDPSMLSQFNEYFPPSHNLSLFVMKLYQSNKSLAL